MIGGSLAPSDAQTYDPSWSPVDISSHQHGTGMAGIALYGTDLADTLKSNAALALTHRLESVKVLPDSGENNADCYGAITQSAVALAEIAAPTRKRAICMAVTASANDGGLPSSWSSAIDQMAFGGEIFGDPKLVVLAAGNLREHIYDSNFTYPTTNGDDAGVEDPAQSWNALAVGAMTERVVLQDPQFRGYQPVAPKGDISPISRTSAAWPDGSREQWPYKPDIVMEGGNWAYAPGGGCDSPDDLALLTLAQFQSGRLFNTFRDTSPATAAAARMAALLWTEYEDLWPETIRALMVHFARWTPAMVERIPVRSKADYERRLRVYGYGVPDLARALRGTETNATVYHEGTFYPYKLDGSQVKTNEMDVHDLPWPVSVLEEMAEEEVTMRVTLSYFIEPSPGRRGWTRKHRYAGHGLRFMLKRPGETEPSFLGRVSSAAMTGDGEAPSSASADPVPWELGIHRRTKGSLHSDWWTGTAAELAQAGSLAVFPVTGWWRERKKFKRWAQPVRYSLIISLASQETDIYTSISDEIATSIEI